MDRGRHRAAPHAEPEGSEKKPSALRTTRGGRPSSPGPFGASDVARRRAPDEAHGRASACTDLKRVRAGSEAGNQQWSTGAARAAAVTTCSRARAARSIRWKASNCIWVSRGNQRGHRAHREVPRVAVLRRLVTSETSAPVPRALRLAGSLESAGRGSRAGWEPARDSQS